jgi:hypothetical protein
MKAIWDETAQTGYLPIWNAGCWLFAALRIVPTVADHHHRYLLSSILLDKGVRGQWQLLLKY